MSIIFEHRMRINNKTNNSAFPYYMARFGVLYLEVCIHEVDLISSQPDDFTRVVPFPPLAL